MNCWDDLPVKAMAAEIASVAASDVTTKRGAGNDAINAIIITFPLRTAPRRAAGIFAEWPDAACDGRMALEKSTSWMNINDVRPVSARQQLAIDDVLGLQYRQLIPKSRTKPPGHNPPTKFRGAFCLRGILFGGNYVREIMSRRDFVSPR